jgi:uncharacterized membrane protein YczE
MYQTAASAVLPNVMQSARDPIRLAASWRFAVRVAIVASALMAVVAITLHQFAHVGALPLLFGTVLAGLAIGLSLPPARPMRPAWVPRPARSTVRVVSAPER